MSQEMPLSEIRMTKYPKKPEIRLLSLLVAALRRVVHLCSLSEIPSKWAIKRIRLRVSLTG